MKRDKGSWSSLSKHPRTGNCRTIMFHRYGDPYKVRPVYCPVDMVDGVVNHVREKYGIEPVEVLVSRGLVLDPGGSAISPEDDATLVLRLRFGEQRRRIALHVCLSHVPELIDFASREHTARSYGMRWPAMYGHTVLPADTRPEIFAWLRSLLPQGAAVRDQGLARLAENPNVLVPRQPRVCEA